MMRSKIILLLGLFTFVPLSLAETIFTVSYEDKVQFPYYMGEGSSVLEDKPGAAVELVKLLETKIPDFRVEFKRFPWKRCLASLEKGSVDAAFNASFKEKRMQMGAYPWKDKQVDTSRRLTTISYSIYAPKNRSFVWDGKQFSNLNGAIGAPAGYSIIGDLEKLGVKVAEAKSTEANLKKVLAGRIDGAALQDVTGDYFLKAKNDLFGGISKVEPPLKTKPYYLMISHQFIAKNPKLAEQIWDAIAELREEKLSALSEKYFL